MNRQYFVWIGLVIFAVGGLIITRIDTPSVPDTPPNAINSSRTPFPPDFNHENWSPAFKLSRRKEFVQSLEDSMLKQGRDFHISLRGKDNDQLHIKFVLMSRPDAYKMANDSDFRKTLTTIGFKKIIATDGYSDTWTIDLQ